MISFAAPVTGATAVLVGGHGGHRERSGQLSPPRPAPRRRVHRDDHGDRRHYRGQLRADQHARRRGVGGGGLRVGPDGDGRHAGSPHRSVAVVKDAYGNLVPGVSVTFAAPASGASATLTGSPAVTGADGQASVTATAGTIAGSYTVTASVAGVTTAASFALTNTVGAAASVAVVSGSGQTAIVATGFAAPLVVVVKDAYGNPVPGVSVTFAAPASGASATLTGSPAVTDADGQASVTATAGTDRRLLHRDGLGGQRRPPRPASR